MTRRLRCCAAKGSLLLPAPVCVLWQPPLREADINLNEGTAGSVGVPGGMVRCREKCRPEPRHGAVRQARAIEHLDFR